MRCAALAGPALSKAMATSPHAPGDIDPRFVFDYRPLDLGDPEGPDGSTGPGDVDGERDDAGAPVAERRHQRMTTYWDVAKGERGPEPAPDWVVRDAGAVDTERGVLKTGKEADVFLVQRSATDGSGHEALMAAKRYRSPEHRTFHRSAAYTAGRRQKKSRDARALARGSRYGRAIAAGQWASAEFDALTRYWSLGLSVPYPVQLHGTEILMEFIGTPAGEAAPRLAQVRPDPAVAQEQYRQFVLFVTTLAGHGVAHGDLSPYNVLADGNDLVVIDMPQVVDLVANPRGREFLERDCRIMCGWFAARGVRSDAEEVIDAAWEQLSTSPRW